MLNFKILLIHSVDFMINHYINLHLLLLLLFVDKEADMCIGGITISEIRSTAVDFTTPHHMEPNVILLNLHWTSWSYFYEVRTLNQ